MELNSNISPNSDNLKAKNDNPKPNNSPERKRKISADYVRQVKNISHPKYSPKIVVVGDAQVGKTSIFKVLQNGQEDFPEEYVKSNGYSFFTIYAQTNQCSIKMNIWDTSSDESYRPALINLCRNANIIIIVFSLTDKQSFDNLSRWIKDIKAVYDIENPICIIANKLDDDENRDVFDEDIKAFNEKYFIDDYIAVSAKDNLAKYDLVTFLGNIVLNCEKGKEVR